MFPTATITKSVLDELSECGLSVDQLLGLCSDGASVMAGKRNGVAAKLKELNKSLVSVHCICHKLSLACCDTSDEIVYIKEVERWLIQIWKFFENSPNRLAIYFKCQLSIKQLQEPSSKAQKVCQKRLAIACEQAPGLEERSKFIGRHEAPAMRCKALRKGSRHPSLRISNVCVQILDAKR